MGIEKIISGGQAGADRAALDWAIARDIPHGGWCPLGRLAEDGRIDLKYKLRETPEAEYIRRTEWNVRDSDATVIISTSPSLSGGSLATAELAAALRKPCLHLNGSLRIQANAEKLSAFLRKHCVKILNIAGPRASGDPVVGALVADIFNALVDNLGDDRE